jgi:hypothetical protein
MHDRTTPGHGPLRKNSRNGGASYSFSFGAFARNARAISGSRGRIAEYFNHNL